MKSFLSGILIMAVLLSGCTQVDPETNKSLIPPTLAIAFPNENSTDSSYWINIDPVNQKGVGDRFIVHAKTNLPANETVLILVHGAYSGLRATQISDNIERRAVSWEGQSGIIKVNGTTTGNNSVIFDIDTSTFLPDDYLIEIVSMNRSVSGNTVFSVLHSPNAPSTYDFFHYRFR